MHLCTTVQPSPQLDNDQFRKQASALRSGADSDPSAASSPAGEMCKQLEKHSSVPCGLESMQSLSASTAPVEDTQA